MGGLPGDIRLFVEAQALGSLSAAGRKLGFSAAAASARQAKLEASLQAKLFHRTTRALRLTEEGCSYLRACRLVLETLESAEADLHSGQAAVRGKVRVSAATDFGRHLLNTWLETFCADHPEVQLALTLTDSLSRLLEEDMDIAIRFGKPEDGSLVARRLAPNWRVLCAAPAYLERYGTPLAPAELSDHRFVILVTAAGPLNDFYFQDGRRQWGQRIALQQAWETNDGALARQWALAGRGIVRKTIWDAAHDLRCGQLKVVLPEFTVEEPGVYAVLHRNRYRAPRVRALLDFLLEQFSGPGLEWIEGLPGAPTQR